MYKMMYVDEVPPKVSIAEGVEIAKQFSTEDSSSFINGMLDSILNDLKKENRLHKTGRGLLDVSLTEH
jgi:N utilization substance protein B